MNDNYLFMVFMIPENDALPSDCRFRADIIALKRGDLKGAADAKLFLEEKQRRDAKLRVCTSHSQQITT